MGPELGSAGTDGYKLVPVFRKLLWGFKSVPSLELVYPFMPLFPHSFKLRQIFPSSSTQPSIRPSAHHPSMRLCHLMAL